MYKKCHHSNGTSRDRTATELSALPQVDKNLLAVTLIVFVNYGDETCSASEEIQCKNRLCSGRQSGEKEKWGVLVEISDLTRAQGSHGEKFAACSAEGTHCQPVLACCFMKCLLLKSIKC